MQVPSAYYYHEVAKFGHAVKGAVCGSNYGQDYLKFVYPVSGDHRQLLALALDGHGRDGAEFAKQAGEEIEHQLHGANWQHVHRGDWRAKIRRVFRGVEAALRRRMGACQGGTTATVTMVVDGAYIRTANIGDTATDEDLKEMIQRANTKNTSGNVTPEEFYAIMNYKTKMVPKPKREEKKK